MEGQRTVTLVYAEAMARRSRSFLTTRRLVIGTALFGLFVAFDIALFAYLIFDSLSQREIENVVFETRKLGEPVAQVLETNAETYGDLPLALSLQVTIGFINDVVEQREWVRTIEVRDDNGVVVYQTEDPLGVDPEIPRVLTEDVPRVDGLSPLAQTLEEVEVPIGDFGTLVIGVSRDELQTRIARLRRDLIQQASAIGILTLMLLIVAFIAIWVLFRRGRDLEEQAREAERMAYIGTLASGLAHEIRNPLNALSLNMQMLEEDVDSGPAGGTRHASTASRSVDSTSGASATGRLLAITQSEIKRLERLVSDFLSYAKPREVELEEVPAIELLEGVRTFLASEIRARGAELTVEDLSHGGEVRVDREQIRQLLLNLSQNALQATERSGRAPTVHLRARNVGHRLALEIEDNGVGISEEMQAKIFDIFFSTRRGGTGLGLAIVHRIAKDHGGRVEVDSTPGLGSKVRVLLPRVGARETTTQTLTLPVLDRSS